jgi:hypothetical protein
VIVAGAGLVIVAGAGETTVAGAGVVTVAEPPPSTSEFGCANPTSGTNVKPRTKNKTLFFILFL